MLDFSLRFAFVFALALLPPAKCAWWSMGRSRTGAQNGEQQRNEVQSASVPAIDRRTPFEMEESWVPADKEGSKLLDELKNKLQVSCWHKAYSSLFSSCREVLRDDGKKMRLAYNFVDCFLRSSGKEPLKPCPDSSPIQDCTKSLSDHRHHLLLQFFNNIASMCHHIQGEAFKMETEQLIRDLKTSTHWVEEKLTATHSQTKTIYENTVKIFGLQQRLQDVFTVMERGLGDLHEDLNKGVSQLKDYAEETNQHMQALSSSQKDLALEQERIADQQKVLSDNLQEEVSTLRSKAEDINSNVMKSLSGQDELLSGQEAALSGLANLKKLQEDVLLESERLREIHQRLAEGSAAILKAQEGFESKQALIFSSLDRLFTLHSSILSESRTMNAVLFYVPAAILIYLVTGTKQTNNGRAVLYLGLCSCFGAEFWSLRIPESTFFYQYKGILSNALYIRGTYAVAAAIYVFYCIFTFKDYAHLSYELLLDMQKRLEHNPQLLGSYLRPFRSGRQNAAFSIPWSKEAELDDEDDPDYNPDEDSDYESD